LSFCMWSLTLLVSDVSVIRVGIVVFVEFVVCGGKSSMNHFERWSRGCFSTPTAFHELVYRAWCIFRIGQSMSFLDVFDDFFMCHPIVRLHSKCKYLPQDDAESPHVRFNCKLRMKK